MSSRTIQELLQNRQPLVTISSEAPVAKALELMFENGYSQLPIVDQEKKLLGIISTSSILNALKHFKTTIERLKVHDASEQPETALPDDDLFVLLDKLDDLDVIVIVDGSQSLIGIVTAHDAARYLRQNAEDLMFSADIENLLKDYIGLLYVDEQALATQLEIVANREGRIREQIKKVLIEYLRLGNEETNKFNSSWFNDACKKIEKEPAKFDELTLNDYIELWLQSEQWKVANTRTSLDVQTVRGLLHNVRDTRNDLAHLRLISADQREQLRFCVDWLGGLEPGEIPPKILIEQSTIEHDSTDQADDTISQPIMELHEIHPTEEETEEESRYSALARYLQDITDDKMEITFRFDEIEKIIGHQLPATARQHRSWWANDSVGHVQSRQWLNAGWNVTRLNVSEEIVTFVRMADRQEAYIRFYSELREEIRKVTNIPTKSPMGRNWYSVITLPKNGRTLAVIGFAFAQGKRFRVELYIDTGAQDKNKQVFEKLLLQQSKIEGELEHSLSWERIEQKRASRIALYYPENISITSDVDDIARLQQWAVSILIKFEQILAPKTEQILKAIE